MTDLAIKEIEIIEIEDVQIALNEIDDPDRFFASERGKAWVKDQMSNIYYTKWYDHQRSPYSIKEGNNFAKAILDAKKGAECIGEVHDALEAEFTSQSAEDSYYDEYKSDIDEKIEQMADAINDMREERGDIPEMDIEAWEDAARDSIVEAMYDGDDSDVMDMFTSSDRCELIVRLGGDSVIYSNRPWSDFSDLSIDQSLQRTLAALGYSISDYRKISGNKNKTEGLARGVRKRSHPLLSPEELQELIDNSCSSSFSIVLYAAIPFTQLIEVDLSKPFVLSKYSIAVYDESNGTFFEITRKSPLVIRPGDGEVDCPRGYSPEDICGLYMPHFHADISAVNGK